MHIKFIKWVQMKEDWQAMPPIDPEEYPERPGLEGPFRMKNGRVVYYDPKEGKYYDSRTDMYLEPEEAAEFV